MTQAYSNPEREEDQYSLPDVEVFYISDTEAAEERRREDECHCADDNAYLRSSGWYWWTCLPGCLPDSDPSGPFDTEEEALDDAQDIE